MMRNEAGGGGSLYGRQNRSPDTSDGPGDPDSPQGSVAPSESYQTDVGIGESGCPECGGSLREIDNECVCASCGLVVGEDRIDRGKEWREFDDDTSRGQKKRTGSPISVAWHDKGLSTTFDTSQDSRGAPLSSKKRSQFNRLKKWHKRSQTKGKKERGRIAAFMEIRRLVSRLDLPRSVRDRACKLFTRAHKADLVTGGSLEQYAGASLYAACRLMGVPRTQDEIVENSSINVNELRTGYLKMGRELNLEVAPPDPLDFVPRVFSALETELQPDERKEALSIVREAKEENVAQGRNPFSFAASAVYHVASDKLTQTQLADVSNSTGATIRATTEDIQSMIESREETPESDCDTSESGHAADEEPTDPSVSAEGEEQVESPPTPDSPDKPPVSGTPVSQQGVSVDAGFEQHSQALAQAPFPDPADGPADSIPTLLVSRSPETGTPIADGGVGVVTVPNSSVNQQKELPILRTDQEMSSMTEASSDGEYVCTACGGVGTVPINIRDDPFCRECGYTLLYSLSTEEWEILRNAEERISEGADPDTVLDDIEGDVYHPPYPGSQTVGRFSKLNNISDSPSYILNITKPLRVSPVSSGDSVQVLKTTDPHGIPAIDLYYVDEEEEGLDSIPNIRTITGEDGSRVKIPKSVVKAVLETELSFPVERYDGSDPLFLWPQVMPDRIRLYAVAFESEWQAMRREYESETSSRDADVRGSGDGDENPQGERGQADESKREDVDAESFSTKRVVEAAQQWSPSVDDIVDGLEAHQDAIDETALRDEAVDGPYTTDEGSVYIVPPAVWDDDSLGDLPSEDELREALRQVHYQTAKQMDERIDEDIVTQLLAMDAVVVTRGE